MGFPRGPLFLLLGAAAWFEVVPGFETIVEYTDWRMSETSSSLLDTEPRLIIEAILWVIRTGSSWREIPEYFGPWSSVAERYYRWCRDGKWALILQVLQEQEVPAPINVGKPMQAQLHHIFRCSCFIRRSLKAMAFLVLPRVRSQVYVIA